MKKEKITERGTETQGDVMKTKSYDDLFDQYMQSKKIYESVVLIETGTGEPIFSKTYGGKDIDSPILAASITKMFTAACIFILVQQGHITLDDNLLKFYEPAYLSGLHFYKGKDYSGELKVSDLLRQTSGLADIYEEGKNSIKKQAVTSDTYITFDQYIALTKERKAHFPPDCKNSAYYADINYNILGDLIEKITKCPLEKVFEKYIFSKINMAKTYLPVSEKQYIPMVYCGDKQLYRPQFIMCSKASGGCITSAGDLIKFTQAFFQGALFDKKFLDATQYRKLQFSMFPICYGNGYMRIKMGGFSTSFLGQGDLIGHSGSTGSFAFYYPEKELFFVGDFNQMKYPALPVRFVMQLAMSAP